MLRELLLRPFLLCLMKCFYRLDVRGLEHFRAAGERCVIVCNHQSFLDPLLLGLALPERLTFAINVFQAEKWYFRWLDKLATLYRLDPSRPMVMKQLIRDLRGGGRVVIFPEGRITTSGGIMKVYDGTGKIVEKTGASLLPVHIEGAQYTKFSRMGRYLRLRWFAPVRITILPPRQVEAGQTLAVYDALSDAAFAAADCRRSLLAAMLDSRGRSGASHVVASDISRAEMSYKSLLTKAFVLGSVLGRLLEGQRYAAVLLPNALAVAVVFVALHIRGKIPCMLNFSSGTANVLHGCKIAGVQTVLTSRLFIEKAGLETLAKALEDGGYRVIYLEDARPMITLADKLGGLARSLCPGRALRGVIARTSPDDPAVILYTSGSEGVPKGVALSHANILSNIAQTCARLDLKPSDVVFNALPTFHSFGLAIGLILPLVHGVKTFLYPSPLHYRVIPDLMYDTDATIMLGTDTFFRGYARYAKPYDFWNIRLAVAGAEKLKESTRQLYWERFNLTIFEGYGVTETSPVISFNTQMHCRHGSVGRLFPGMQARLEPVAGMEGAGRLHIRGPNVMLGYLDPKHQGQIVPQGEWYDTGDIVAMDEGGYITIQGRAKRFAKIGGEMVSLAVAEDIAASLYPEHGHAAIAVPDERKGEQVILFTEQPELTREAMLRQAGIREVSELYVPRKVVVLEALPRLGNGKTDYVTLQKDYA